LDLRDHRPPTSHGGFVAANNGAKGIEVLEQNLFKNIPVQRNVLHVVSGVTRKEFKTISTTGAGDKKQLVAVEVTRAVEVTGQIWAYRAQAKQ
jgi:hypothetical protein